MPEALAEGAISRKYKELMTLAVALTTRCPYCLDVRREAAKKASATEAEPAEAVFVAVALRAGAGLTHSTHLLPPGPTPSGTRERRGERRGERWCVPGYIHPGAKPSSCVMAGMRPRSLK